MMCGLGSMNWTAEIKAARQRVAPHVRQTPVMVCNNLIAGMSIEIKLEHMQHTGSFKARGAFNSLLSTDVPASGVVAASGGNHGAAVAYAANQLGHKASIFVPDIAGPAKIELIRQSGIEPVVVTGAYVDALREANKLIDEGGAMSIHAYDGYGTVIGQGTCMAEWEDQGLQADTVLIAVGGGGLIGGALGWLQGRRKIVGVEPEAACTMHAARAAGQPVDVAVSGVAANALGAGRLGDVTFGLTREFAVENILVTDDAIIEAQVLLWNRLRIAVEPAGATGLAALISGAYVPAPNEKVALLLCGANLVMKF